MKAEVKEQNKEPKPHDPVRNNDNPDKYTFTDIPDESILTITIGKTRKRPEATAQVTPKQKFNTITTRDTTIRMNTTKAPKVEPDVTVKMADSSFALEAANPDESGLTRSLTCAFTHCRIIRAEL